MNINFDINCVPPKFKEELNTIEKWLKFQDIYEYEITEKGVRIDQDIRLKGVVGHLPFEIIEISGNVDISYNPIISFRNFPKTLPKNLKANGINIRSLTGMPVVKGNMSFDSCKSLVDISAMQEVVWGDLSFYGCSVKNINLPKTKTVHGDVNLSNNGTSSISIDTNVEFFGSVSLSENLITNHHLFTDKLKSSNINFSGNPCTAQDEWETECNW